MQSLSTPIERLHAELQWFCRASEVRLAWVECAGELRSTIVGLLPRYEFHHDNRSAWVMLEDAHLEIDHGWQLRANRLVENWAARRAAFADEGVELPELTSLAAGDPWTSFAATLARACTSLCAPLEGLVLVLAPTVLEAPQTLEHELRALLKRPELAAVRFVIVTGLIARRPPVVVRELGERGMHCLCEIDDDDQARDLAAMLDPARAPGVGAGAVPVGIQPPQRRDRPAPLPPEQHAAMLREAGLDPAYLEAAPVLGREILGAALAMKQGRGEDAVRLMTSARDRGAAIGQTQFQVLAQITLASYLAGLGARSRALTELHTATEVASVNGLWLQQCQAQLALGLLHAQAQELAPAEQAYATAGLAAERGGSGPLAIESWRMAGQLRMQAGDGQGAATHLQRALALAEQITPAERQQSSAPEAARSLARLYASHGHTTHADALYAQADAYEEGNPGPDHDRQ